MFRLQWHVIPDNKVIGVWLTFVYGIGIPRSREILKKLDINYETKVSELTDEQIKSINDEVNTYLVESDLRREVNTNIKRLKEIRTYRGMRHAMGLPVRWQNTRKHAKTAKKLLWRARVRPTLKK